MFKTEKLKWELFLIVEQPNKTDLNSVEHVSVQSYIIAVIK